VPCPSYTKFPSYVAVQYLYEFVTPYSFIAVVIDPTLGPVVKIETTNPLDFGSYALTLRVTEEFSLLQHETSFTLQITCVRGIIPATTVSDLTYYIHDNQQDVVLPIIQLNPLLCPNELLYTLEMQNGSPLPSTFSLDATKGAEKVSVYENMPLQTGVFPLKVILTDPTT